MARLGDIVEGLVAPGEYSVVVDSVSNDETRDGTPKVRIEATVVSGQSKGTKIRWDYIIQPNMEWKFGRDLVNAGVSSDFEVPDDYPARGQAFQEVLANLRREVLEIEAGVRESNQGRKFQEVKVKSGKVAATAGARSAEDI